MEGAFSPGYDPALELATHSTKVRHRAQQERQDGPDLELDVEDPEPRTERLRRKEQDFIDLIVNGEEMGHYYVLLGAKVKKRPSRLCRRNISTSIPGHGKDDNDFRLDDIHSS